MKSLLLIFLGGGTGSVLRYLLTISIYRQGTTNFPWGTFAVAAKETKRDGDYQSTRAGNNQEGQCPVNPYAERLL